jgi:hypothetical protein
MRYDERQVYSIVAELRGKLGLQQQEQILAQPKVIALKKRYEKVRAALRPLEAEDKAIRKEAAALGLRVSAQEGEFEFQRSGSYNNPMPDAALKTPRVRKFEQLERRVRTAIVGGDRAVVVAALEALIAHVDSE